MATGDNIKEKLLAKPSDAIKGLGEIAIRVNDLEEMHDFYANVIGLVLAVLRAGNVLAEPTAALDRDRRVVVAMLDERRDVDRERK